ncbi:MASE3 domain-containing protein [Legionella bononiensis]|uniref:PAS domain S-box protein n=1 Tax=Legionella bononiensis TaxID=2793102 RepID=A0ABS1WC08_9GAMM|nr:MASE3 domain-containing protein [Legionella bononiensis]MBL7481188.1 PAS domain S-box protein [Legionella bononiensis]MBL7526897.1 PAS domain S-box protein [Legionella bononiensis]MBL7563811.1 PAS domain S-box protein [Legionella bononiensis]
MDNLRTDIPQSIVHTTLYRAFIPPVLLSSFCLLIYYYTSFTVFHTVVEVFSVFIGFTAMTVATTTTQFTNNQFVVFISITAGWCAGLDLTHILVYKGMNLIPGGGGNESTQLWISARFLQAFSFLIAPFFFRHSLKIWIINLFYGFLTSCILIAVFTGFFPQTYIENYGLTWFKIISEWGVASILFIALIVLWHNKSMMSRNLLYFMSMSITTLMFADIILSHYTDLFGLENIIGHLLKIFSYWFIYVALVVSTLREPFSMLARAASTYDNIPDPTMIVQSNTLVSQANSAAAHFSHLKAEDLVGLSSHDVFHDKRINPEQCPVCSQLPIRKDMFMLELEIDGLWLECSLAPISSDMFPNSWVQVIRNITDRKQLEIEHSKLLSASRERLKEISCLYTISKLIDSMADKTIEEILMKSVMEIPKAFQFPDLIVTKIESKWGDYYSDAGADKTSFQIDKDLFIDKEYVGKIVVYYSVPPPVSENIFLPEERTLLDSVASQLIGALNQILAKQKAASAEVRFKESEQHFQAIIDQTGVGVYVGDKSRFLYVNPKFCIITGWSKDDLLQKNLLDLIEEESIKKYIQSQWNDLYQGKSSISYQFPFKRKDGVYITLRSDSTIINWEGKIEYISLVQDITEIENAKEQISNYISQLEQAIKGTFTAVSNMVEMRDPYTAGHERRVGLIAKAIGEELGWSVDRCASLELIGLVHDVGKISIPAEILSKPSKLTDLEMELIKGHAEAGYNILKDIHFNIPVAEVILQHHERLDGSGYPRGLKGNEILPETLVISVADVLEAMSSYRPYRPALGVDVAIAEIKRGRGILYDAQVVDAACKLIHEKKIILTHTS